MNFSFGTFFKKYWQEMIFAVLFVISIVLAFLRIKNYDIAFTLDQAREMLEIRRMIITRTPLLIGPATDIIGLYYGPFWYYFNSIPFLMFGGDPLWIVRFQIIVMHIISVILYLVLRKKDRTLALYSALLFLFSPVAAFSIKFSWNANSAYYFAALFPLFLFLRSKIASFFEGVLCGVILQVEAAVGILFFPIAFILHVKRPKTERHFIPLITGFFITFLPQIAFEIHQKFLMTKSLLSEFTGGTSWLGQRLPIDKMILNRFTYFRSVFSGVSYLPLLIVLSVIILALIIGKKGSENMKLLKTELYIIFAFLIFFIVFPFDIREWYLYGLVPFSVFSFAASLTIISGKYWLRIVSVALIAVAVILSVSSKISYLTNEKGRSDDPGNLNNLLRDIDYIYTDASGYAFKVYTYTPQVYDSVYQYLFWWYGTKKYDYQPAEMSYLPGVPEYIKNNSVFWNKKKESGNEIIYLIIQHDLTAPDREKNWRNNFPKALENSVSLPWDTTIEKLRLGSTLKK